MTSQSGFPADPSQETPSAPPVLQLREVGKAAKQWALTLFPSHLELLESPADRPYVILREEMMKSAVLIEGMRAFSVQKPRKINFQLEPDSVAALAEWIGKPVMASFYLKRRYGWVLPVAIIWMLASLPIGGDAESGRAAMPFDPVSFLLGTVLVVSWAFAKYRPHPVLFLVDSLWFAAMGGNLVYDVTQGRSKGWLILVLLLGWMIYTGIRYFLRFRGALIAR